MKEILEYALERLEDACRNGEACDVQFWSGYADGVRACMRAAEERKEGCGRAQGGRMCYEDLRQLYAATAKERDELKKELERMKCLYEMVKAERYWLFELVEGTCISCKRQYGSPGVNCSLCKESDDLWEYAWEGK